MVVETALVNRIFSGNLIISRMKNRFTKLSSFGMITIESVGRASFSTVLLISRQTQV